jgi:hypothetical protein
MLYLFPIYFFTLMIIFCDAARLDVISVVATGTALRTLCGYRYSFYPAATAMLVLQLAAIVAAATATMACQYCCLSGDGSMPRLYAAAVAAVFRVIVPDLLMLRLSVCLVYKRQYATNMRKPLQRLAAVGWPPLVLRYAYSAHYKRQPLLVRLAAFMATGAAVRHEYVTSPTLRFAVVVATGTAVRHEYICDSPYYGLLLLWLPLVLQYELYAADVITTACRYVVAALTAVC